MGHPKRGRKKYERPKRPYDKERIKREKKLLSDFGLKRKAEIWKAESILRNYRRRARELLAKPDEKKQTEMFERLNKQGFRCSKLDDVLTIKLEDILSRRLQTLVYKKGITSTPKQARQLIVHKHILVDGRRVAWPSYIVPADLEEKIEISQKIKEKMTK